MATECFKNCCKTFLRKNKEAGIQVRPSSTRTLTSRHLPEDYLISKLPADGREVSFVLPMFKASYVQPRVNHYPIYEEGLHYSTRRVYADWKAELSGTNRMTGIVFPGSAQCAVNDNKVTDLYGSVCDLRGGKPEISHSTLDLPDLQTHMQRFDSVSSVRSSISSVRDSLGSSRSLESVTLSGDERDLGKLSIRLNYQEALEQIWITLVQCKDLYFPTVYGEQQKIGIKGLITIAKPVRFKSSIKEGSPDMELMETFVFNLPLKQLCSAGLVLRLQTHLPQKRTLGECVLSLRQLGPHETLHWLDIHAPSKASMCLAELQIATCFQPVCGRIQFQVLGAQNVPTSSAPLSPSFFVKAEMYSWGRLVAKRKTQALRSSGGQVQWSETFLFPLAAQEEGVHFSAKLYSRSSVRRKRFLGQVHLGFESPTSDAVQQWRNTISHPEEVVSAWHKLSVS